MKKRHFSYLCLLASQLSSLLHYLYWYSILLSLLIFSQNVLVESIDQLVPICLELSRFLNKKCLYPKNLLNPRKTRMLVIVGIAWNYNGSLHYLTSNPVFPESFILNFNFFPLFINLNSLGYFVRKVSTRSR